MVVDIDVDAGAAVVVCDCVPCCINICNACSTTIECPLMYSTTHFPHI